MKKYILSFLVSIASLNCYSLSNKFEFKPLIINFRSIETKGDTIAALGDFGSMLISFDDAISWNQIRVFDKGKMVKLFFEDTEIVAFNDIGQVSTSNNNGKNWELMADLNDSVFAVIEYPEGYFFRSDSNLKIISKDFKIVKEFSLYSKPLGNAYKYEYRKSLVFFKNYLIAAIDSARFLRFDINLALVDTFDLKKFISDSSYYSYYQIEFDSNYFYTKVGYKIYKTQDFTITEIAFDSVDYYKLINNEIYFIRFPEIYYSDKKNFTLSLHKVNNKDSSINISELENTYVTSNIRPKDFSIVNNKLIIVGNKKLILTLNLNDNNFNIISDFSGGNYYTLPDIINDSTCFFYCGFYYGTYYNSIYKSINKGITFKPVVDTKTCPEYRKYFHLQFKYYNDNNKTIYLGSSENYFTQGVVMISSDYGKSFSYKAIPDFYFSYFIPTPPFPKFWFIPNVQRANSNFLLLTNYFYIKTYTKIITYNSEFDIISMYKDSNYLINYIYSKDTNSYLIHCVNYIDTTREIRFTSDKGLTWSLIKKYSDADSLLYYKEITIDYKPALAMFLYNNLDSFVTIEILDFETRIINKIYSYKETRNNYEVLINNGIYNSNDTIYIAIKDTLFFANDIYNKSKWKYINFPYNGKIIRTFAKFGEKFFARYSDDIHPNNIYWIKIIDWDKPKPMISSADYIFGKRDIKSNDTIKAKLKIENLSTDADLNLTGYSIPGDTAFTTDLPKIDTINSLIINPGKYFEFNVIFHPTEVKVYNDSIVFYSN
ncbi:MAG: hypothetical protein EPN82_03430, partial [Bacteroidetes bacterium]